MKLKNNQQAFIALVRAGLWEKEVRLLPYKMVVFEAVYKYAQEQSVIGLVAAGLEHVIDVEVPKDFLLTTVGRALQQEQENKVMNKFVGELFEKLQKENIKTLLIKGQGLAQCYERPLWRACGDVDLLMDSENYNQAKQVLSHIATSVDPEYTTFKHVSMQLGYFEVELHGCLHTRLLKQLDTCLDALQDEMLIEEKFRVWKNAGVEIKIPPPEYDVLFVFTHILHHFYVEGIGLRQVCDWCRLLWTYRKNIDHELLKYRLFVLGIETEWKAFAALAVDYLGMPGKAMPLYSSAQRWSRKADRIMAFVIKTGNFGHNRKQNNTKIQSVWRKMKDFGAHCFVFPIDSVKFFFHFMGDGLKLVIKKN